jgi:Domain of unknown function (DUF4062)
MMYRVFVSSTAVGLRAERDAVRGVLERMRGAEFAGMEIFGSRDEDALTASLHEVDASDLYVGIVGGRYGSGITRAEYERARERGIACLLYIQREDAISFRDEDPHAAAQRTEWIARLTDTYHGHAVTWFMRAGDLAAGVATDVHNWLYRRLAAEARQDAASGAITRLRALLHHVHRPGKLRAMLVDDGVAVGDDLLDSLLALYPGGGHALLGGVGELPTDYAARIENFLGEYLGTPDSPVPFGGRGEWLAALDAWLALDTANPCLLIAGEAGRGKSAALVHWSRRWIGASDVHMVFVPVSIRFRTNLASVFFPVLAARLAHVHGDEIATDLNLPVEAWRGLVADFLRRPPRDGSKLVVVIDGLDEAADWEAGPDLFPRRPRDGVRIVVSARLTATCPNADAWLDQLGWTRRMAQPMPLEPLTRTGVREVVVSMGFPLNELGTKVDVIQELHRLSGGDPLMVRLYVDRLWERGAEALRLVPEDLAVIRPGLEGYFERWWREQKALWGDAAPLKERSVRAVLNLLAAAFGPLAREDILGLAPAEAELTTWTLTDALQPLRRFVFEESAGLVFNHPRFAQYLMGELTAKEQATLDERFVEWSAAVRDQVETGTVSPVDLPRYLIQHSSAHLERLGRDADALCALLTPRWRQAWESLDGGLAGFESDVDRAFRAARQEQRADLAMLCVLLKASMRSISHRIPAALVEKMLQESVWHPKQAIAYARSMGVLPEHAESLAVASQFVPAEERTSLLDEARAAAGELKSRDRQRALLALVRAGDPVQTLLGADSIRLDDDIWFAAVKHLVTSGRLDEAGLMCAIEPLSYSYALNRWLIGTGRLDTMHRLRRLRHAVAVDAETEWELILFGDEGVGEPWGGIPHERIKTLQQDLAAGRPVHLTTGDLYWIQRLFGCWDFSGVISAFAWSLAQAMEPVMRDVVKRILRASHPRPARRAVLLEPDRVRHRLLRQLLTESHGIELPTIVEELMPLLHGKLLELAVASLAGRAHLKQEDYRNLAIHFVANDVHAFRQAVIALDDDSDQKLLFLCAAADADEEGRGDLVRRIHASLTRRAPAEVIATHLDVVAPHLDGPVLRAVAGALSRLSDEQEIECTRFLIDPRAFERPPALAGDDLTLLTACLSPDDLSAVIQRLIATEALKQPAVLDLLIATRVPRESADDLEMALWTRILKGLPAGLDSLPWMRRPPDPAWLNEVPDTVLRLLVPYASASGARLIGWFLLGRLDREGVLKRHYHFGRDLDERISRGPLRHIVHLLEEEDREHILAWHATAHAILALAPLEPDHVSNLYGKLLRHGSAEQLCALLPLLTKHQRTEAVRELISNRRLPESVSVIRDVLLGVWADATGPQIQSMQHAFATALTSEDVLRIVRMLWNRPELATLIAGIHRHAPLPPSVLKDVLELLFDPARQVLRPVALQDIAVATMLQGGIRGPVDAAIDRAVAVFP